MTSKIKILVCLFSFILTTSVSYGQMSDKELKKDLKSKVDKECRKQAKALTKQGWKVMPGKLSIERQLQQSKYTELDVNEKGDKRFFTGTHQAIGGNYTAAKQIADNRAHVELANSVYAVISQKIEDKVANNNLGEGDIQVIDEFVSANKSIIYAQLSGITPVLEMYREKDKGQYEVWVMTSIDSAKAIKQATSGLNSELKKKSQKLAADLDVIFP